MAIDLPGRPYDVQLLGYSFLIEHYGLDCPPPKRLTAIAQVGAKQTQNREGQEWLLLPKGSRYRVPDSPIEHLGVALKHENLDMRVLSRLFSLDIEEELGRYISQNPAGIYTRRAWFLYEWMTTRRLDIEEPYAVQYVKLLDPTQYIVRRSDRSMRHKVDNNLTGVPAFCPLVRKTERLSEDRTSLLAEEARQVVRAADPAVLRRAVGFLLLNESKGSFGIEGESPPRTRLERWGRTIAEAKSIDLNRETLLDLQKSLFDPREAFVRLGYRDEGGFVGRHDTQQQPIPDHVSARPEDLDSLISGLFDAFTLFKRTKFDPILTAALIGFGFVFIHPFEDGNGRLHRFIIQKALVDRGFNPDGVILPVSAAILEDIMGYRTALEEYSATTLPFVEWEPTGGGNVNVTNDTAYLYRYFDATRQAEYLLDRIERTVKVSLPSELDYLHKFDEAKRRMAEIVDMPDRLSSLFIQFCMQNSGRLSNAKREKFFPKASKKQIETLEKAVLRSGILARGEYQEDD